MFDPSIFRRYDIRGRAGAQVSPALAEAVGRALGDRIVATGKKTAAVGRDVRHSSPELARAAARGLAAAGLSVRDLGIVPTPVLYHALSREDLGGGIMVTGSHNPREDNGLKLCLGQNSLYGEAITSLLSDIANPSPARPHGIIEADSWLTQYLEEIVLSHQIGPGLKVGVDCGNGVMGPVVLEVLRSLGVQVAPLYCEPDGDFPNHIPDPEVPKYMEALGRLVREQHLDCGLGFDGDGDRLGVLDETGRKISADALLLLFAEDLLLRYPGGKVRFDVKCSDFLFDRIRAAGGEPVMGETGHSLLKRDVKALDAIIGGELSGHIVFNREYLPIDDSMFCALRFLALLQEKGGKASGLFADLPELFGTAEIKLPCADLRKFAVVEALAEHFAALYPTDRLDGARVRLKNAWFLVRASNTTPNLTVRLEAESQEALVAARDILLEGLRAHSAVDASLLHEVAAS